MRKTHICVLAIAGLSVAAGAQDASAASAETTAAAGSTTAQTPVVEVIECSEIDSADVIIGNSAIELIYTTPEIAEILDRARQIEPNDGGTPRFAIHTRNNKFIMSIGGNINTTLGWDLGNNLYKVDGAGINFIPGDIPVPAQRDHKSAFFINPIDGNINFTIVGLTGTKNEITAYIKIGTNGISSALKLKRAYLKWRGFTFGQATTLASDGLAVQPPTIDPQGPAGDIAGASYQINYTSKSYNGFRFAIGLEMPSFYSSNGVYRGKDYPEYEDKQVSTNVDEYLPDVPMWVEYAASDDNRIRATAILRNFSYRDLVQDKRRDVLGWGTALSGNFSFYKPLVFNFQAVYGRGIGAYIQDLAGRDISFTPDTARPGHMKANDMTGLVLGASYNATKRLQFNAVGSYTRIWGVGDYAVVDEDANYKYTIYAAANCFYKITSFLTAGVEYIYGRHTTWNKGGANDSRVQAQIAFKF